MAAEKRDFTDFTSFPGGINEAANRYEFPRLSYKDENNRKRIWQIFVRLIKYNEKKSHDSIDWNMLDETEIPLKDDYFYVGSDYCDLPVGTAAQVWSEGGIAVGKITRVAPKYFSEVANVGRANQRNQLQQALIYARKEYINRRTKSGAIKNVAESKGAPIRYFPMLASPFKTGEKHIKYPISVQYKYDGVRCISYCYNGKVDMYTRTKKDFPGFVDIREILLESLPNFDLKGSPLYLDGELYKHGVRLQDISGTCRNEEKNTESDLEYHIYDCFYAENMNMVYSERSDLLRQFYESLSDAAKARIILVPTYLAASFADVQKIFKQAVSKGYEGCILRNNDGVYKGNANKSGTATRSKDLIKYKKKLSEEFEITGFKSGRGKDKDRIIWECRTKNNIEFNVVPNETLSVRNEIYKDCLINFDKKYRGAMLTVEFEALSDDGVPQRAKAVGLRNYE
jgi:hypothetical protein